MAGAARDSKLVGEQDEGWRIRGWFATLESPLPYIRYNGAREDPMTKKQDHVRYGTIRIQNAFDFHDSLNPRILRLGYVCIATIRDGVQPAALAHAGTAYPNIATQSTPLNCVQARISD